MNNQILSIVWILSVFFGGLIMGNYYGVNSSEGHTLYMGYRKQADNRINLLEHYMEKICHNMGFKEFFYDKEKFEFVKGHCSERYTNNTKLSNDNLYMHGIYEKAYLGARC